MNVLDDFTASCTHCDRKRYVIYVDGERTRARTCKSCFHTCPACQGTEFTYVRDDRGYEVARQCPVCGALKRRIQAFNDAKIPRRHQDATLDTFQTHDINADGQQGGPIGNLPRVRFQLYNWVRGFAPGEQGFLLHGNVGTGKTHLLSSVIRHLTLEKGIPARFVEFTHLLSDLREQFDRGKGETELLRPLVEIPVLAIDELGKGRRTDWQISIIEEIISKRYNRSVTTLFTTNYPVNKDRSFSPDLASGTFGPESTMAHLAERIGERSFSRLFEMAEFIGLEAPDFRRQRP